MNNIFDILTKFLVSFIIIFIFSVAFYFVFQQIFPRKTLAEYYSKINSQEHINEDEFLESSFLLSLENCKANKDQKCFVEVFEEYTAKNSIENSFSKLNFLLKQNPEYRPYCHQIAHGIGHGALIQNNGDIGKALSMFSSNVFFKNLATCGNGYHHGLIEEVVKDEKDVEKLISFFQKVCNEDFQKTGNHSECMHGLGHAAFIQLDYSYDLSKPIYVCEQVSKDKYDLYNCLTGVYMEKQVSLPSDITKIFSNGRVVLDKCEKETNGLRKAACYSENVFEFQDKENILQDRTRDKNRIFQNVMNMCVKIENVVDRLACVKNTAVRAIVDEQHDDINICFTSGLSKFEKIMCVTTFAHRLGLSLDHKKGKIYKEVTTDICKNLNIWDRKICNLYISKKPLDIYFAEGAQ